MMFEDMLKAERQEGIKEGFEQGEARMSVLISYLLSQKRIDDLERASTDLEYRSSVLREMEQRCAAEK